MKDRDFYLLFVGSIVPIMGVDVLLRAIRMLAAELKNLKVVVDKKNTEIFDR